MKRKLIIIACAAAAAAAQAQHNVLLNEDKEMFANDFGAVYSVVGRSNDPFVFCTQGVPSDGWIAVDPLAGTYKIIRKYPDLKWIPQYQTVCPAARSVGAWLGGGSPDSVPFKH